MILYRSLRLLLRYALELYFVDIQAAGAENIPASGPVIFAANHPNSIMDTVILGTQTSRSLHYLARSGLFKNPFVATLFNQCGVIPIYRAQDNPTDLSKNLDSFRKAYDVLDAGGAIGIFPEGKNSFERRIRKIKTGTARIALGAAARKDYELDVTIVPVGLNFENRDRFLSSVLVKFGTPISVTEYTELHKEDEREAVQRLTRRIEESIRTEAVHIESEMVRELVRDIDAIYGHKLASDLLGGRNKTRGLVDRFFDEVRATPGPKRNLEDRFWVKQRIADGVAWFIENEPELVERIRNDIRKYKDHLKQVELRGDFFDRPPETLSIRKESIKFTVYAILFSIPAVWGLIWNVVPYTISKLAVMRAPDEAMRAFTGFCFAAGLFPLWYGGLAFGLYELGVVWWAILLFILSLPPTGFFYMRYRRQLARYRSRVMARTLFRTNRNLIRTLARERKKLIAEFDELREHFVALDGSQLDDYLAAKDATSDPSGDGPRVQQ